MVTAYPITAAPRRGVINDAGDQAAANKKSENRDRIYLMCQAAAKIGMLYRSAGNPATTNSPIAAGAFCIDTTNDDVYVCTDRSTPTWTVLAE